MSQRPKLKRETAQDIEDLDIDSSSVDQRMVHHLSRHIFVKGNKNRLIHQKSAPGTPMSPKKIHHPSSKTPSRTPSDESWTSGFLSVPNQRLRGSSFSGDSEFSSRKVSKSVRVLKQQMYSLDRILKLYLSPSENIQRHLSGTAFHSSITLFPNILSKIFANLLRNSRISLLVKIMFTFSDNSV